MSTWSTSKSRDRSRIWSNRRRLSTDLKKGRTTTWLWLQVWDKTLHRWSTIHWPRQTTRISSRLQRRLNRMQEEGKASIRCRIHRRRIWCICKLRRRTCQLTGMFTRICRAIRTFATSTILRISTTIRMSSCRTSSMMRYRCQNYLVSSKSTTCTQEWWKKIPEKSKRTIQDWTLTAKRNHSMTVSIVTEIKKEQLQTSWQDSRGTRARIGSSQAHMMLTLLMSNYSKSTKTYTTWTWSTKSGQIWRRKTKTAKTLRETALICREALWKVSSCWATRIVQDASDSVN